MSQISPLLLQAQITLNYVGGELGLADSTTLENPFQGPMWIDEIRFRIPATNAMTTPSYAWAGLRAKFTLAGIPLTNGFVPLGLLGKVLNDSVTLGEQDVGDGSPSIFTWKLPRPIYIPAREFLRPTLYLEPGAVFSPNTFPRTVTIIYACRPVAKGTPPPEKINLPWVTFFKPPYITMTTADGGSDAIDQSQPSDIFNPWPQNLHVQRFVGRLMGIPSGEDQNHMSIASANINLTTGLPTSGTFVTAQDSFNNILVRDPTPFAHLFDFIDRAWTVNAVLPPKGFYLFTVDRNWTAYKPFEEDLTATVGISMISYREIDYVGCGL